MDNGDLDENALLLAARLVREHYYLGKGGSQPDWILIFAIKDLLRDHPPVSHEDLGDVLLKRPEIRDRRFLSRYLAASVGTKVSGSRLDRSGVFSGGRKYSLSRIAAMTTYLIGQDDRLCKTRLTGLLFYSDFVHYHLYGRSISGARYIRGASGPELLGLRRILKAMTFMGVFGRKAQIDDKSICDRLTVLELVTMHWAWETFGQMTADEITECVEAESVHRFTRVDHPIAYEYARLLQRIPDRSVL